MARLYPPSVAGTLPSCYNYPEGIVTLTIPFSMNKTVAARAISSFRVRIKTTSTDRVIADWPESRGAATLDDINPVLTTQIPTAYIPQLRVGNYYKVQIAYVDSEGVIGYYSSLSIIKYTGKPTVRIADLSISYTNLDMTAYVGEYFNQEDPTEIVYQYKFLLYNDAGAIIENSGWRIHNSYEDEQAGQSRDTYVLKTALELTKTYRIQYCIITNNNLELHSPRYMICQSDSIEPQLKAKIFTTTDYDNGSVTITLLGDLIDEDGKEEVATGTFLIQRSSSSDNFTSWVDVLNFKLTGEFPSNFVFHDFTVEQGETYRYSLQQYNDYGIYSRRILAEDIYVAFEDAFLFDGKRQLRIRYNPKIASFKTTLLDSKKNTIGGKFPTFFRNGNVEYKEFSISGLVTYFMDNDEFFFKKDEIGFGGWENTTDIIDANIYLERQFKLAVLDWLNNGEVKLFRSPQEGNYIVRLMNTTLAPNDSLSRMLHTFTCQASEIADFNTENLTKYNLIQTVLEPVPEMRWRSINLAQWLNERITLLSKDPNYKGVGRNELVQQARRDIRNGTHDLAEGKPIYYIKVEDVPSGTKLLLGHQEILIGATGYYEAFYEEPMYNLRVSSINVDESNESAVPESVYEGMNGTITYGTMSTATNTFDTVTSVKVRDVPCRQFFGPQENLLAEWNDIRLEVQRVYYARFVARHLEELVLPLDTTIETLNAVIELFSKPDAKNKVYYYTEDIITTPTQEYDTNKDPIVVEPQTLKVYYLYYYNGHYLVPVGPGQTQFTDEFGSRIDEEGNVIQTYAGKDLILLTSAQAKYAERYAEGLWNSLTPYYVYYTKEVNKDNSPEGKEPNLSDGLIDWKYTYYMLGETENGTSLIQLENYDTTVKYHKSIINVADIDEYYIPDLDYVPDDISIGSGVYAEIGLQYRMISYYYEQYLSDPKVNDSKLQWLEAEEAYRTGVLKMIQATNQTEPSRNTVLETVSPCYYFDTEEVDLRLIEDIDRPEYKNRSVPIYYYSSQVGEAPNYSIIEPNYNIADLKARRDETYAIFVAELEAYKEHEEADLV